MVVSERAVYLLKAGVVQPNAHGGVLGGLAGALVQAAMSPATTPDDLRTCRLFDLSGPVQAEMDPKKKYLAKDVIVLPKESVRRVKVPAFNNAVEVFSGGDRFVLLTPMFRNGKVRRSFTEMGWTINREVQPVAAPMHARGLGGAGDPPPNALNIWVRILLVLLAVAVIVAAVALRATFDRHR